MPMPAHMTIEGENQGNFEGSVEMKGREGTMLVEAVDHTVNIPRDPQSGLATGKRQHRPFVVTKVYDKASPKIYQACCTGEHMKSVKVKWYRIDKTGKEQHYFTHELKNALIVSTRAWMPNCLDPATESFTHMEEVAFTYESISWTFEDGGIMAEDSWQNPIS